MKDIEISIFFPIFNDQESVRKIVNDAKEALSNITENYEIILVNDASKDNSGHIADQLAKEDNKIKVVHHQKNRGYGGALKSGFLNCTKSFIFYTDGDNQYDIKELKNLVDLMEDNIDIVNGYKISRGDPWYRKVIGKVYHHVVKIAFGLKVKDVDCDFRLMRRKIFDKVELESNSGVICVELMKKIHMHRFKIKETPVHHYPRPHGKSQFFNFGRIYNVGKGLLCLWYKLVFKEKWKKKPTKKHLKQKEIIGGLKEQEKYNSQY